jgi:hypothetical protein
MRLRGTPVSSTIDYNCVVGNWGIWSNGTTYNTLAAWQTASSVDASSTSTAPSFVNSSGTTASDFQLTAQSAVTGADLSAIFTTDYFGNTRAAPWSLGFHEYAVDGASPPVVSGVSPSTGSNATATSITITGSNFTGSTGVTMAGTGLSGYTEVNAATIYASVPAGIGIGSYNVLVTNAAGSNTTSATKFTVTAVAPTVSSVTPAGTFNNTAAQTITIAGTGFFGGVASSTVSGINVNGVTVTIPGSGITSTSIPGAIIPAGIGVGTYNIVVTAAGGSVTGSNLITVTTTAPTVTSVTPAGSFNNTAARTITIAGTGFFGGVASSTVSGITVNGVTVTIPGSGITNTSIPGGIIPAGIEVGTYNIVVTTAGGSGTGSNLITITTPTAAPTVSGVTPAGAFNNTAARTITIAGTGFFGGTGSSTVSGITVNGVTVTIPGSGITNTSIPGAIIPAGIGVGTYDIVVTAAGGNGTGSNLITVTTNTPTVTTFTPSIGTNLTTTLVTINGSGFFGGAASSTVSQVKLDDGATTALTGVTVISDVLIRGVVPAGITAGSYNVKVTAAGGTNSTSTTKFTVTNVAAPDVTLLTPGSGTYGTPVTVSVTGSGFYGGGASSDVAAIKLYTTPVTTLAGYTVASDTLINNLVIPGTVAVGTYLVKVTTFGGGEGAGVSFTINPSIPTVTVGTGGGALTISGVVVMVVPTGAVSTIVTLGANENLNPPSALNDRLLKSTVRALAMDFGELDTSVTPWRLKSITFDKAVTISIPYAAADVLGLDEQSLRIFLYNDVTGLYEIVTGTQTVSGGKVTANVMHFSTYRIFGTSIKSDLDGIVGYPSPVKFSTAVGGTFKVINLPSDCVMLVYNIAGEKIRTLNEANQSTPNAGFIEWDGKNESGEPVGQGVYIYVIKTADGGKKTGKVGVVK